MPALYSRQFGKLTVLSTRTVTTSGGNPSSRATVRCTCGAKYELPTASLYSGQSTQCVACRDVEYAAASASGYKHPLHHIWQTMIARCYNPEAQQFQHYGGRGITVCADWRGARANGERATIDGFRRFVEDMPPRPTPAHSIDRINNNGPYELTNCRWATRGEQQNNKRTNVLVTYGRHTRSVTEWGRALGYKHEGAWAAMAEKWGVPLDRAVAALVLHHPTRVRKWKQFFADIDLYGV